MRRTDPTARTVCAPQDFDAPKGKSPTTKSLVALPGKPGERGFNAAVRRVLEDLNLPRKSDCNSNDDQFHQRIVAQLVQRQSPISRLLVAWIPGTGKTLAMIRVLDNFFEWPAPKLILFPTQSLVDNFYKEFIRFPNRYMSYWREVHPNESKSNPYDESEDGLTDAQWAKLNERRADFRDRIRSFMELWPVEIFGKQHSGMPAPLRAYTFDEMDNPDIVGDDPKKRLTILNWPNNRKRSDVCNTPVNGGPRTCALDFALVLVDEAHNVIHPTNGKLPLLRKRLYEAHQSVVVLFTATPVLTGAKGTEEANEALKFTKGHFERQNPNHEGFVSWYMERPAHLFATTRPAHLGTEVPNLFEVRIDEGGADPLGGPWVWRKYCHDRFDDVEPLPWRDPEAHIQKMRKVFSTKFVYSSAAAKPNKGKAKDTKGKQKAPTTTDKCLAEYKCKPIWSILEHVWFDTQTVDEREAILEANLSLKNAADLTPKLAAIAHSVRSDALKTLVLIHEPYGALVLWWLLHLHGLNPILLRRPITTKKTKKGAAAATAGGVAWPEDPTPAYNRRLLIDFNANDNLLGERCRVAVAVVEEFGEGVSFIGVRRIILASLSGPNEPPRWPLVQQWVARALRMCSHDRLPEPFRTLDVDLFVARTRPGQVRRTVDEERLEFLRSEIKGVARGMAILEGVAIDAGLYTERRSWWSRLFH